MRHRGAEQASLQQLQEALSDSEDKTRKARQETRVREQLWRRELCDFRAMRRDEDGFPDLPVPPLHA